MRFRFPTPSLVFATATSRPVRFAWTLAIVALVALGANSQANAANQITVADVMKRGVDFQLHGNVPKLLQLHRPRTTRSGRILEMHRSKRNANGDSVHIASAHPVYLFEMPLVVQHAVIEAIKKHPDAVAQQIAKTGGFVIDEANQNGSARRSTELLEKTRIVGVRNNEVFVTDIDTDNRTQIRTYVNLRNGNHSGANSFALRPALPRDQDLFRAVTNENRGDPILVRDGHLLKGLFQTLHRVGQLPPENTGREQSLHIVSGLALDGPSGEMGSSAVLNVATEGFSRGANFLLTRTFSESSGTPTYDVRTLSAAEAKQLEETTREIPAIPDSVVTDVKPTGASLRIKTDRTEQ